MQHYRCRPASDKRSEKRLLCSDLIKARWVVHQSAGREEVVVLESFSIAGASLFVGIPIREGTPLTLCAGGEEFRATARHCVRRSNGYLVGVSFGVPSEYIPEHLLDTSRLIFSEEK